MQLSARRNISYPDLTRDDRPDIPLHIKNLVDNLDLDTPFYFGLDAALPAAAGKVIGSWYWATDTTKLYMDTGAAWIVIYPVSTIPADGSITGGPAGAGVKIAALTITHDNIAAGTIRSTEITDATITAAKLANALKPSGGAADATEALRALGTIAGTAAAGNDGRLSDARVPTAHATTHRQGGTDETSHLAVNALPIYETGVLNQLRAGRVLALVDFTTLLGITAPEGLWNLGDLTDISGNGGNLTNKGAVTFGLGITGNTPEAAIFHGGATDALYVHSAIYDLGGYGSWSCWFRTAKKGTTMTLISKYKGAQRGWYMEIINNVVETGVNLSGVANGALTSIDGVTVVTDERWHHARGTYDGTMLSLYIDGVLEAQAAGSGPIYATGLNADLNIGSDSADAATNASNPFFGRIDEAVATADVLSLEQDRMLYAAKIAHGFPVVPNRVTLNVRRRRKGGTLGIAPFSTQPLHLHDFTAGSLVDAGSLGNNLTNNGAAVVAPGADGVQRNAFNFVAAANQYLSATDAGLPAGAASALTVGCWFRALTPAATSYLVAYGTAAHYLAVLMFNDGTVNFGDPGGGTTSPQSYGDGIWHQVVGVRDPAATDGLLKKNYIDGKLVQGSAVALDATVLLGAAGFRVGRGPDTVANYFGGAIDGVFITNYAMNANEIAKLYAQGALDLPASPKNPGDHIEGVDATNIYAIFDTLDSQHKIDLLVSA